MVSTRALFLRAWVLWTCASVSAGCSGGGSGRGELACTDVPVPVEAADAPLDGEGSPGRYEFTTAGGFGDAYLYDSSGRTKVGVRREWGGAIVFFGLAEDSGPGTNPTNAIDAGDTGRNVQTAVYDPDRIVQGCAWNASCRTGASACPATIPYLGWNPVQAGNRCQVGSGADSLEYDGRALRTQTSPLFWNPDWERPDCVSSGCGDPEEGSTRSDVRISQSVRFVAPSIVEIDTRLLNEGGEDRAETAQEMPTLYTANGEGGPNLWRVMDSNGNEVPVDTPAGGDGFLHEEFESPAGWVAMQDGDLSYGVGLFTESRRTTFDAWQLRSVPFNNVRARFVFGLPAGGEVRARAYLILGSYETIADRAAWLDRTLPPFGALEAPAADERVERGSEIAVRGWALDNKGVESIEMWVDSRLAGFAAHGSPRPDVCLVRPGYEGCQTGAVGFDGRLDSAALGPCAHLLEIRAVDEDGNARVVARRRFSVDPG